MPADDLPFRHCRVYAGEQSWAWGCLSRALRGAGSDVIWVGEAAPPDVQPVRPRHLQRVLGRECSLLVFDAHTGFAVDPFIASLGTLRAGGVLFLLVPALEAWPVCDPERERLVPHPLSTEAVGTRFLQRFRQHLEQADCITVFRQGRETDLKASQGVRVPESTDAPELVPSAEQQGVIEALQRVALGHAHRPLVVTADRGRGKSTALGLALARLLSAHDRRVVVLAPQRAALDALLTGMKQALPAATVPELAGPCGAGHLSIRLAHEQVLDPQPCDLLVVDEAAAIALPVLQQLLEQHHRVVFCSTVHGYEGSGRGLALRFFRTLDQQAPGWRHIRLAQPVRWSLHDPLEELFNRALVLDADPATQIPDRQPVVCWVSQDELLADETLLRRVFALLVSAHYQTRPSDLRQLLDAPGLHVLLARASEGAPLGVLLAVEEGGFEADLAAAACRGQRRPRGHMLVQSLAAHAGLCGAPQLRLLRVMRIAVTESARERGIGSLLLKAFAERASAMGFDLLGAAYAVDARLLRFWERAGYRVLRLGQSLDPASGSYSLQMAMGINAPGRSLVSQGQRRFQAYLPWRLLVQYRQLDPALAAPLLHGRNCDDMHLDDNDWREIRHFAEANRQVDDVQPVLWRWLCSVLADIRLDAGNAVGHKLVGVVLQGRMPGEFLPGWGQLEARKPLQKMFRAEVGRLLGTTGKAG